jgi:hypothetical protein
MPAPQNIIAIVYDYDQTLSPTYMQEEVLFPQFGIDSGRFWKRCQELVKEHGYDNELAYMKVMLDYLGMDRPTNAELRKLGEKMTFYKGLPGDVRGIPHAAPHATARGARHPCRTLYHLVGLKVLIEGSRLAPHVRAIFGCEFAEMSKGALLFPSG